ncbi:MAG: BatD family protein, partial [Bacteroidota bacterium]
MTSLIGDNLFLKATVDKTRVMQGEQINLTFKLYTRVSVLNYAVEKVPSMRGFWSEDVETPKNISLSTEVVNGKQYRVGVIKRLALFPTQAGTLEISPMEVQTTVQVQPKRSTDPFESFFRDPFGRNVNHLVKSSPVKILVSPLPASAPGGFKGAVGQFAMSATVDRRTTRTNEPVTLKITISGTGNIKLLESPEIEVPPDFERYSPKVTDSINRGKGRISGSKTFEHLLIPRYPGLKVIKPLTFCYYDLGRREYVTLRSPQIELNVEQGSMATPQVGGGARADVQLLTQDIRFIKISEPSLGRRDEFLHTGGLFIALLLLPLAGLAGAFVFARQRQAEMHDQAGYRNRRAIKVAQKGLKQAEYLLKERSGSQGEPSSIQRVRFYAEVSRALWKYLGDKLGIPQSELSLERVSEVLTDRSVNQGLIHALRVLLESCDMARFAPTGLDLAAMQKTYEEARRIIIDLEKTLKSS